METMEESRVVTLLEPVTEGVMQLFCQVRAFFAYQREKVSRKNPVFSPLQMTILYIALGPGPIKRIDLSHLLYGDTWSWLLYTALLATSVLSVGISFSKVAVD